MCSANATPLSRSRSLSLSISVSLTHSSLSLFLSLSLSLFLSSLGILVDKKFWNLKNEAVLTRLVCMHSLSLPCTVNQYCGPSAGAGVLGIASLVLVPYSPCYHLSDILNTTRTGKHGKSRGVLVSHTLEKELLRFLDILLREVFRVTAAPDTDASNTQIMYCRVKRRAPRRPLSRQ